MKKYFAKLIGKFNGVVYTNHKLFLVSRDIQVGNEIYLSEAREYHKFKYQRPDGRIICDSLNGSWPEELAKQDYFKVIGEISPGATWVRENDEFDEKDVKFSIFDEDFHVSTEDTYEEAYNHSYYEAYFAVCKLICLIKGPCGHFH